MNRPTKIILASVAVIVLIAGSIAVKLIWFPGADESIFREMTQQKLKQSRSGIVMVRPTRYPEAPTNDFTSTGGRGKRWLAGRNVTLQQLVGIAYDYNPGKVWIPANAPKNNYDFIVTALSGPQQHLRGAIQKKLGYVASVETRDTDVMALKVKDRTLPGMKESAAGAKRGENFKNGRLYLTHQKPADIIDPIASVLKIPVIDKTGLTGYYDFSLEWNEKLAKGEANQDDIQNILGQWGLGLEPDTAPIEMLAVKKAP